MDDDLPPERPRWSDEPEPLYKGLAWGCLLLLILPIVYLFFFVMTFCENNCG
jgi:hypothetical protein